MIKAKEMAPWKGTISFCVRIPAADGLIFRKNDYAWLARTPRSVISMVQRISCASTGTAGESSCSRQISAVGQRSCGSRRS